MCYLQKHFRDTSLRRYNGTKRGLDYGWTVKYIPNSTWWAKNMGIALISEKIIIATIIIIIIIFDDFFRQTIIENHIYGCSCMGRNGLSIFSFFCFLPIYDHSKIISPKFPSIIHFFQKKWEFSKKMMLF